MSEGDGMIYGELLLRLNALVDSGKPFTIHGFHSNKRVGQGGMSWSVNIGDDLVNVRDFGDMDAIEDTLLDAIDAALERNKDVQKTGLF